MLNTFTSLYNQSTTNLQLKNNSPFPPAPGNHPSTFCLYEFHSSKDLIHVESYSTSPLLIGLFHLAYCPPNYFSYITYNYIFSNIFPNTLNFICGLSPSWSQYSFNTFLNSIRLEWIYTNVTNYLRLLLDVTFGRQLCSPLYHQPFGYFLGIVIEVWFAS